MTVSFIIKIVLIALTFCFSFKELNAMPGKCFYCTRTPLFIYDEHNNNGKINDAVFCSITEMKKVYLP